METWNKILVDIIKEKGHPLSRRDLHDILTTEMGMRVPSPNLGVHLNNAKKDGILAHIKLPPAKIGYYCNPEWLDENNELKEEYKYDPFWSFKQNKYPV